VVPSQEVLFSSFIAASLKQLHAPFIQLQNLRAAHFNKAAVAAADLEIYLSCSSKICK